MQIKPAALNSEGTDRLISFANNPQAIGQDQDSFEGRQAYLPGVWVPEHTELSTPFSVPLIGDNESTSLTLDWPVKEEVNFYKRIALTAMLPAESVIRGEPLDEDEADLLGFIEFDERFKQLNEAFDDYTGEWGGFLYAAVNLDSSSKVRQSLAEFIVFESSEDFESAHRLLGAGMISAAEIVGITHIQSLVGKSVTQHAIGLSEHKELPSAEL